MVVLPANGRTTYLRDLTKEKHPYENHHLHLRRLLNHEKRNQPLVLR
jgi:hypothetical protein